MSTSQVEASPCPTRKVRYASPSDARAALTRLLRVRAVAGQTRSFEQRSYQCGRCDGWHVTSMPRSDR